MKLLIAITLVVAVSAFPPPIGQIRDGSPIVFRHWKPITEWDINNHGIHNIPYKNIFQALPLDNNFETPDDVINALKIIHHILNNKEDDDDDGDETIIAINDEEDGESDVDQPDREVKGHPPHNNKPNSDRESTNKDSGKEGEQSNSISGEKNDENDVQNQPGGNKRNPSLENENSDWNNQNEDINLLDIIQPEDGEYLEGLQYRGVIERPY